MKRIKFSAVNSDIEKIIDSPSPSINFIPDWYRKMSTRVEPKNIQSRLINGNINATMKACVPVFDAITAGYMITLPSDVEFFDEKLYGYRVSWDIGWKAVSDHFPEQIGDMVVPNEYERSPLKWESCWNITVPSGYSLLYTHPFYRYDLPFISATGIVDADEYNVAVNIPFFIKKNFYGIIPQGTPIAQIIPIKRERWVKEIVESDNLENLRLNNLKLKIKKSYKTRWWKNKRYE